eukprot:3809105-Pyramimonas_sp.AAC.1
MPDFSVRAPPRVSRSHAQCTLRLFAAPTAARLDRHLASARALPQLRQRALRLDVGAVGASADAGEHATARARGVAQGQRARTR